MRQMSRRSLNMNLTKKRKLEAADWRETTVKEFLDLSDADMQ